MVKVFNPVDSFSLIYTQKCNIKCLHCVNECSPQKKGKLDFNMVLLLLKNLPEFKVKKIGITGGEPLLYPDEMLEIISTAKKYGVSTKLITNGFWASTPEKAEEIVSKLSSVGLKDINISTDEFHLKFIPVQNITNIFSAVRKQKNLRLTLRVTYTKNHPVFYFVIRHKDYFIELNSNKKAFGGVFQPLIPFGRAFKNISKENYITLEKITGGKCKLGQPTINHDGKFFVCCNASGINNSAFELGNFNSDSVKKLIESYQKSLLAFYLRTRGAYSLAKLAERHNLNKVNKTKKLLDKYVGLCDFCVLNLGQYSKEDLDDILLKEFKKDKRLRKLAEKNLKKQEQNSR